MKMRLALTCVCLAFGLTACGTDPAPVSPLNVLILSLDTTRADHIGCYGHDTAMTPHLDAFARDRAVRFDQAIATVPLTLPSHTSIMTGTYPIFHGIHDNDGFTLDDDVTTLAEILSGQGYSTGAVLASFPLKSQFNLSQGFEEYNDYFQEDWTPSEIDARTASSFGFVERTADRVNAAAFRWLDQQGSKPFFLWMHYFDPHQPYEPPPPYDSLFPSDPYDGEIAFADENFGKLMAYLEKNGLIETTIIVVIGDHGEALGDHGEPTHASYIYDPTVRVPLLISIPDAGQAAGQVVNRPVSSVDIAPTLLEYLGQPVHPDMQGHSLVPDLRSPNSGNPQPVLAESHFTQYHFGWAPLRALRTDRYKYILAPSPELYDMEADPEEIHNIALSNPRVASEMDAALEEFVKLRSSPDLGRSVATSVDASTRANLEALGYLASGGSSERAEAFPERSRLVTMANPRDRALTLDFANAASEALRLQDPSSALELARHGLETDPNNFRLRVAEAQALMLLSKNQQAIEILDVAAAEKPSDAIPHVFLGRAHLDLGNFEIARDEFEIAEGLEQDRIEVLNLLAYARTRLGDLDGAIEALENAVEVDPNSWSANLRLGTLLTEADRWPEARAAYQSALARNPYSPVVLAEIGRFYLVAGEPAFAVRALSQAVTGKGDDPVIRLLLVEALTQAGADPEEIRPHVEELSRLAPDTPAAESATKWMKENPVSE